MAYILILIGIMTNVAEGTIVRSHGKKYSGGCIFTGIISLFSMIFFLVTDTNGFVIKDGLIWYSLAAGIMYGMASVLTYEAFARGSFALSNLILSYALVFTVCYGIIFLKENATVYTYIGFVLLVISIFLMNNKKEEAKKQITFDWVICITLSFIGSGMFGVIQRMQQIRYDNSVTNEFMVIALGISSVMLFTVGLLREKKGIKGILTKGNIYAAAAGIFNGLTNMTTLMVNTMFMISRTSVIRAGVKTIIIFLISSLIYKEKFAVKQLIAVGLGAISVIIFNI